MKSLEGIIEKAKQMFRNDEPSHASLIEDVLEDVIIVDVTTVKDK